MDKWIFFLILFVLVDFVFVGWILWRKFKTKVFTPEEFQYIKAHWIRIIDAFESHPKQCVMDADKLLDYALGRKGYAGTMGEKLRKSGSRFSDQNGVWQAHKLRNRVAHELGDIRVDEGRRALRNFKQGLNDLGARL